MLYWLHLPLMYWELDSHQHLHQWVCIYYLHNDIWNRYCVYFIHIEASNTFFFAQFDLVSNSFSCHFTGYHKRKSCSVMYGVKDPTTQNCHLENEARNSSNSSLSHFVTVFIPPLTKSGSKYCFIAKGSTTMLTVAVEGTFYVGNECVSYHEHT